MGWDGHDPSEFTGRDDSGCVRVSVEPDRRYSDITLSTSWRERVGVHGLTDALIRAAARARQSAADAGGAGGIPDLPVHEGWASELFAEFENLSRRQQDEALFRIADQLNTVTEELDQSTQRLEELRESSFTGTDDRRRVTVALSATGDVESVTVDETWLGSARIDPLNTALRTALTNAQEALDAATAESGRSSFADRAHRMTAEPGGVRRWLSEEGITDEQ